MSLETLEFIGAAHWSSYLINGDASGLTDAEREACDAWCERQGVRPADFVDVSEPRFSWSFGFFTGLPAQGGDVADFTALLTLEA